MVNLSTATFDRELNKGDAPDWVHLLPSGHIKARDGREFELVDPDAVVRAFEADAIDLPIDFEHQVDRKAEGATGPIPAAGWIDSLKSEPSGIWVHVAWTATAREMISKREYRYLSPSILYHPQSKQIIRLKGAGLVHRPALHLTALASQEDTMTEITDFRSAIIQALGLPADADDQAVLDAIKAQIGAAGEPDPSKFVPIEAVKDLMKDRNNQSAIMCEQNAKSKVEDAFRRGFLTTAMKDWATALCLRDEDVFDDFLASAAPPYAHLLKPTKMPAFTAGHGQPKLGSDEAEAVCHQLGLKPGTLGD